MRRSRTRWRAGLLVALSGALAWAAVRGYAMLDLEVALANWVSVCGL